MISFKQHVGDMIKTVSRKYQWKEKKQDIPV